MRNLIVLTVLLASPKTGRRGSMTNAEAVSAVSRSMLRTST